MVQAVTEYMCEFKGCGRRYPTVDDAVACEDRGLEGPIIEPGFTLGGITDRGYLISTTTSMKGHERSYSFVRLMDDIELLKRYEQWFKKDQTGEPIVRYDSLNYSILSSMVRDGSIRTLPDDELLDLNALVKKGNCMEYVRTVLGMWDVKELYNRHEAFNPIKREA